MSFGRVRDAAIAGLEGSSSIEKLSETVHRRVVKFLDRPVLMDVLSGRSVGHPLHPLAVQVPMACWSAVSILDLAQSRSWIPKKRSGALDASTLLLVLTGSIEWIHTRAAERRVGAVHAFVNVFATGLYGASLVCRNQRKGASTAAALSFAGLGMISIGGWLGGHLAYVRGVGVNATAFLNGPREWKATVSAKSLVEGEIGHAVVDGVHLVLVTTPQESNRKEIGERASERGRDNEQVRLSAFESRCTHRGAPLHEGKVVDGCVQCPWHGSEFELMTGRVRKGPASISQTPYATRISESGIVEVRTEDPGGLRASVV
jgi:nitrite reductase/ring-hydroxylating ferredoxin subunit/uncharacterized membrane protein